MGRCRQRGFFEDLGRAFGGPIGTRERQEQRTANAAFIVILIIASPFLAIILPMMPDHPGRILDIIAYWLILWIKYGLYIIFGCICLACLLAYLYRNHKPATGPGGWTVVQDNESLVSLETKPEKDLIESEAPPAKDHVPILRTQLQSYGCDLEPWQFRELLTDLHFNLYPGWTVERLTLNPDAAKNFCNTTRARVGLELPDEFILGSLCNIRRVAGTMELGPSGNSASCL